MTAKEVIAAVQEALNRSGGMDIVYIHPTPYSGAVAGCGRQMPQKRSLDAATSSTAELAAVVRVGTPAYEAISEAYPDEPLPPHDHIEPGMF